MKKKLIYKSPKLIILLTLLAGALFASYLYFISRPEVIPGTKVQESNQPSKTNVEGSDNDPKPDAEQESTGSTVEPPSLEIPDDAGIPVETNHFSIYKNGEIYEVELFAIINRPEQYDEYKQQLAQYKQEALDYLTNQGLDVDNIEINYTPEEAKDL